MCVCVCVRACVRVCVCVQGPGEHRVEGVLTSRICMAALRGGGGVFFVCVNLCTTGLFTRSSRLVAIVRSGCVTLWLVLSLPCHQYSLSHHVETLSPRTKALTHTLLCISPSLSQSLSLSRENLSIQREGNHYSHCSSLCQRLLPPPPSPSLPLTPHPTWNDLHSACRSDPPPPPPFPSVVAPASPSPLPDGGLVSRLCACSVELRAALRSGVFAWPVC